MCTNAPHAGLGPPPRRRCGCRRRSPPRIGARLGERHQRHVVVHDVDARMARATPARSRMSHSTYSMSGGHGGSRHTSRTRTCSPRARSRCAIRWPRKPEPPVTRCRNHPRLGGNQHPRLDHEAQAASHAFLERHRRRVAELAARARDRAGEWSCSSRPARGSSSCRARALQRTVATPGHVARQCQAAEDACAQRRPNSVSRSRSTVSTTLVHRVRPRVRDPIRAAAAPRRVAARSSPSARLPV
jgi:hypothetical protein